MVRIQTGCKCIDDTINGGISEETIALIYGEPETGKTTFAIQCAVNCAVNNLKVLFVDCDNTFYAKRLSQISKNCFDEIAERIILVKPKDFREQTILIDHIQDYAGEKVGLIIFDTFTSLYGARVCQASDKAFSINRELNRQLAILAQIVRIRKIPIIITSQVRSTFNEQYSDVRPVATRVLKFWADTIISFKPTENFQAIKAIVEKSPDTNHEMTCYVQIGEAGIRDTQFH